MSQYVLKTYLLKTLNLTIMSFNNKAILEKANEALTAGDYEKFLSFCTDDTVWTFVGDQTLRGKEAVRDDFPNSRYSAH